MFQTTVYSPLSYVLIPANALTEYVIAAISGNLLNFWRVCRQKLMFC